MRGHFTLCLLCELHFFREKQFFGEKCYRPHWAPWAIGHGQVPEHTATAVCPQPRAKSRDEPLRGDVRPGQRGAGSTSQLDVSGITPATRNQPPELPGCASPGRETLNNEHTERTHGVHFSAAVGERGRENRSFPAAGRGWGPGTPGNVALPISRTTAFLHLLHPFRSRPDGSAANPTVLSDPQGKKGFISFSEQNLLFPPPGFRG